MRRFIALLLLICVCGPASKASAAVVISYDDTDAQVYNGSSGNDTDLANTGGTIAVATLPGYSSTVTSLFNPASMSGSFVQSRQGNGYSTGQLVAVFTTDANTSYTVGGSFSNSGGDTVLYSEVYDLTDSSFVFLSSQESAGGPAAFTVGGLAGNYQNFLSGSLTGTLLAGHTYDWVGYATTLAYPEPDGGAEAGGYVTLTLGTAAVPEASSMIVWSLLALTIGGAGWWQKRNLAR
jgi:hypothetical protein